jgi:hypothetical protein
MNRNFISAILLLVLGAGLAARAQETNSGGIPDWSAFESIAQKNIFDPTRSGPVRAGARRREPVIRAFTFCGSDGYVAFFTGEGTPRKGYVKVGDLINGFKVRQITLHFVKLAEPGGNIVELKEDNSMRREEDGPWTKSDEPGPAVAAAPETPTGDSAESSNPSPPSAGESDILARLRARHKQEEQ